MNGQFAGTVVGLFILGSTIPLALAHEGETHSTHKEAQRSQSEKKKLDDILKSMNTSYLSNVKPIFQKSCFDCHSSQTNYPWYSSLPGAKHLIQSDIKEAKVHLDMSNDFPFAGHGLPKEDLEAIRKAINEGSMPPFRYRIMHSNSKLTAGEKAAVLEWVESSLRLLDN